MAVPAERLTARLRLCTPRLSDASPLFALMGDAEVMRHTYRQESPRNMSRHLARQAWGKGFAGEIVGASLTLARAQGLAAVRAFVHPDNCASRRVLERAGFTVERYVPTIARWLLRITLAPQTGPAAEPGG